MANVSKWNTRFQMLEYQKSHVCQRYEIPFQHKMAIVSKWNTRFQMLEFTT
jgi:hypothetical protein